METYSFETLPSTQRYLTEALRKRELVAPVAVWTRMQTDGIGSRDNRWIGEAGNFFASFSLPTAHLPRDLPLASASVYLSWLMRRTLHTVGCRDVWVKWPNDFYVGEKKAGGTVTHLVADTLVWGIGLNLRYEVKNFGSLQCPIDAEILFNIYVESLENLPSWKQVFSEYKIEFERSRGFYIHIGNERKSLKDAVLCDDGSLIIEGRKVYSGR